MGYPLSIHSSPKPPPKYSLPFSPKMDSAEAGLVLALGLTSHLRQSEPSLTLSLHGEPSDHTLYGQDSSSLSNTTTVVKRERETVGEEVEIQRPDDDDDGSNGRKKLRLTKAQSAFLEQSFKHHSTLNPKQKLELARDLKLRPRQVEVWFQNRRARTKVKQTEIDCEFLKRCCESLTDENRRLQKELQELKSLKANHPLYMQLPLTMCPSCERIAGSASENAPQSPFAMAPKPPYVLSPFTNPSAAC